MCIASPAETPGRSSSRPGVSDSTVHLDFPQLQPGCTEPLPSAREAGSGEFQADFSVFSNNVRLSTSICALHLPLR